MGPTEGSKYGCTLAMLSQTPKRAIAGKLASMESAAVAPPER